MPEFCRVEREGRVLVVTLAREEVMNALHPPANFELEGVFDEFAADPELWVAIIELHGSFAQTGQGHGTDRAIVAGLLNLPPDDPRIRQSFAIAEAQGLSFRFEAVDLGEEAHPNTVRLTLQAGERQIQMIGASVGGGLIEITGIQGYEVHFSGAYDTLLVIAEDRPGTINAVTGWLLKHEINVAFFRVGRQQRGGEALMIIETDHPLPDPLVEAIEDFDWVR